MQDPLLNNFEPKPQNKSKDPLDGQVKEFLHDLGVWINKKFKQSVQIPAPIIFKNEQSLSFDNKEIKDTVVQMSNTNLVFEPDLVRAAQFITGVKEPNHELMARGLEIYEDDPEMAILYAFGIERTEHNRNTLRSISQLASLKEIKKSEEESSREESFPLKSAPGHHSAIEAAEAVQRAIDAGKIFDQDLGGKYSEKSKICKDPKTGQIWLLKPSLSRLSPAAGAREERANLAQREAAFYAVAVEMGLGQVIPKTFLLKLDGKDVAALPMLPPDFKNANKFRKEDPRRSQEIFDKYAKAGELHRFAAMDWILANADRNGGNVLISPNGTIALIDHGSSFCGESFNPAFDESSFCPFYLRYMAPSGFKKSTPEDRLKIMPKIHPRIDDQIKEWLLKIDEHRLKEILNDFGINPMPSIKRLINLKEQSTQPGMISDYLNGLWAGKVNLNPKE